MLSPTVWAVVFIAVGLFFLATLFRSKENGRPAGRRSRAFRVVFAAVLLTTGALMLIPSGDGARVLYYLHFPTEQGLKQAGVHPVGMALLALPALSAFVYALCAFLVFGEKRTAR